MDKISIDEIKRGIEEYEKDNNIDLSKIKKEVDKKKREPLIKITSTKDKNKKNKKNKNSKKNNSKSNNSDFEGLDTKKSFEEYLYDKSQDKTEAVTSEFRQFEYENKPLANSWYEKSCRFTGNIMKIDPGKDKKPAYQKAIETAHLNISPEDAFSFSILGPLLYMVIGLLISVVFLNADLFFVAFFLLSGISIMIPLTKLPFIFANIYRMKSSKEIVLSIFYIVTYMRQNSNLEKAIEFAAQHLSGPLAAELKKVLWNVESQQFSTIKQSLDNYLEKWRDTNPEFIESMNLIESSLFESSDDSRIQMLDKSLDVILSETYEKMLHYSHDIQSPISTLHMLGVILPILGLVILPLVVSFMENVSWYNISVLYNVIIPVSVFFVGKNILATRPGGYGSGEISKDNPMVKEIERKKKKIFGKPIGALFIALLIFIPLFTVGISPLLIPMFIGHGEEIYFGRNVDFGEPGVPLLDYRESKTLIDDEGNPVLKGPYGMISTMLGLCVILAFGLGVGAYYFYKTKDLIKIREDTRKLEDEFGSSIFQLGNRLGDGIPLEMAFNKVTEVMGETPSGKFFSIVDSNIRSLGMSPEQALFDKKMGALQYFPSSLILSTMKVLTESIKKGPIVASHAMTNVAQYVKQMHSVEERLKDLLSEVISSMNSLVKFLAPVISGIVVGITSMITNIIGTLSSSLDQMTANAGSQAGALAGLTDMFGDGIPTYAFQLVVGMYIVQVVYIISQTISGISNGDDKLGEEYTMGKFLLNSTTLYVILAFIVMLIFNTIAMSVLGKAISAEVI